MAATRRLAAIMFTDMVGSTALAQRNEAEALRLRDEQEELVRPLFAAHQGREIKSMGDGFLAEFDSALRAVQCAIDIQQRLHERNSQWARAAIQLRIGIHLGDVEVRGTDIFGDSVNVASRIQPLAEPGGICVTEPVFGQVWNKIPNKLEKLEPKVLKNIQFPIEIYRILLPWTALEAPPAGNDTTRLAVLPFTNMSPDPADLYFADGLTEELITVLSQLGDLRVIARTSVMQYKSSTKPVSQIGSELGVSSVLEGSVRRAGNRLRITAQLIAVGSQEHVWAKSYDRELNDVLEIQTEIAKQVAEALRVELRAAERMRLDARPPVKPDSYLAYLKGRALLHDRSEADLRAAKEQFELAIRLDNRNAWAYSGLSDAIFHLVTYGYEGPARVDSLTLSRRYAERAVELDPHLAEAHASLGNLLWFDSRHSEAEKEFLLALSLNPSYPSARAWYALLLEELGRPEEALQEFALAEQADPLSLPILSSSAQLLRWLGRLDEAQPKIEKLQQAKTFLWGGWVQIYEYYMARADPERALQALDRAKELRPGDPRLLLGYTDFHARRGQRDRAIELLRQFETQSEGLPYREVGIADVYTALGDLDEVFRWLNQALDTHWLDVRNWRLNPNAAQVRADPRFQVLLKRMKLA